MENEYTRTEMVIGSEAVERLKNATVAVFGIGGVGGNAAESLVRAGVGHIILVDNDIVSVSNINRQVFALHSTVGMLKTEAAKLRLIDIAPNLDIKTYPVFYTPENAENIPLEGVDYIIDAIDTVTSKIEIIRRAKLKSIPVISSMGTGNKLDPTRLEIADISKTSVCPLARVMRYELKKRNISGVKVLFSKEEPVKPQIDFDLKDKQTPGSVSFVPSAAGIIIAAEVIKDIINKGSK